MSRKSDKHNQDMHKDNFSIQELIDSRQKYKDLVDNLPQRIFLKDKNSVYISCNKAFADDRGRAVNEIQGLTDFDLFPRHLAEKFQKRDQTVIRSDAKIENEEYYPAHGRNEIVKSITLPVHDGEGKVNGILGALWSITKEKEYENALIEKEKQFHRFIDKASDSITLTDIKGKIVYANQKACEALGYAYAELTAAHMSEIDPAVWSKDSLSPVWKKLSTEEAVITESNYHRKDGSSFPVEVNMGLHDEGGKHLVLSIARDITPRHLALQQRASLGKIIEDSLNETYILLRDKLQFLQANRGARENIQFSAEELKAKSISDLCPELTGKIFRQRVKPLDAGSRDRIHFETLFRRKDGTSYPADVFVQAAEYLFYPVYVIHALDITMRREFEQKLQSANDIINTSSSVAFIWEDHEEWPIRYVSENVRNVFGYPPEELTSREMTYARLIHQDDLAAYLAEVRNCADNPQQNIIDHSPYRIITRNNASKWVSEYTYIKRDEHKNILFFQGIVEDITERKKLEDQLFQSEKFATIAGLAAGVAHEINTPLSAIIQSILVITNALDSGRPDNRQAAADCGIDLDRVNEYFRRTEIDFFLNGVRESAIKAANIITTLLDFSRPHKGDMKMVDINELLNSAISLARADYDLKKKYDILNFTIQREYDPRLPLVTCVPMEIEQVVLNLLKNAVQAVVDGGNAEKPHLILRTGKEDGSVRIEVEDNGPGINEEEQKHIFDPFYTTKEVGVGTGLGLSVSFAIIHDKHHGTIEVESVPGKGAKFIIKIPVDNSTDI